MASVGVDAMKFECDGCGRTFLVDIEVGGPPHGYHGEVSMVDESGGWGGEWFACQRGCIKRAVLAAVERTH